MTRIHYISIIVLVSLFVLFLLLSVRLGQLDISFTQILEALTAYDNEDYELIRDVILNLRLPRIVFAALAGCGLALCGYVMQASVQNVLADPYILGISSGASLGAAFAILTGFTIFNLPLDIIVSAGAFAGALTAITVVYLIAGSSRTGNRLVLAGVIVNILCTAISNMLIYTANDVENIRSITFWTMGSLANISWMQVFILFISLSMAVLYFMTQYRALNLFSLGDETASTLGIDTHRKRKIYILIVALLTGTIVAQCGIIGFVGLIIPHTVRMIYKTSDSKIIPVVLLGGSAFLVGVDLLSRTLLSHQEIPIGIITSIIGAPVFLFIFLKQAHKS